MEKYLQQPYYNSLKLKTTQFPNNREQINELQCIHMMVNELLPTITDESQKHNEQKKSNTLEHILCDSTERKFKTYKTN